MNVEQAIRDYLPHVLHLSLATSQDNMPWVCEVHFAYDENLNLYFRSLLSRRHSQEILSNPNVAGNIVMQHGLEDKPRGVYFEGTAEVIESADEIKRVFACLKERLNISDTALEESQRQDGHKFFKIMVKYYYLFDSRESTPSQKYKLQWHE